MIDSFFRALFLVAGLSTFALAIMGGAQSASPPAEAGRQAAVAKAGSPFELLAGPSILLGQVGMALAARFHFVDRFALEAGGVIPHQVSGYASDSNANGTAQVSSYGETHLALVFRFVDRERYHLDAGAGFSAGFVTNHIIEPSTGPGPSYDLKQKRTHYSPWLNFGAAAHLTPHLTLRLDLGFVDYQNTDTHNGNHYDLEFGGLMIRPMVGWRF